MLLIYVLFCLIEIGISFDGIVNWYFKEMTFYREISSNIFMIPMVTMRLKNYKKNME